MDIVRDEDQCKQIIGQQIAWHHGEEKAQFFTFGLNRDSQTVY